MIRELQEAKELEAEQMNNLAVARERALVEKKKKAEVRGIHSCCSCFQCIVPHDACRKLHESIERS
jgi:hypothetical protein